jgi:hypothetical protein
MRTKIFGILIGLALGSGATLVAAPFPLEETPANETRPQVAYDTAHDRYLVVWDTGSGISGRLLRADGTPVAAAFPVLWNRSGERYAAPSVTFKSHLDRFYVAAIRTDDVRARTDVVIGAGPTTVTRRILSDTYATPRRGASGAYSPVRHAPLAVWHEFTSTFTNANDVWGAIDDP